MADVTYCRLCLQTGSHDHLHALASLLKAHCPGACPAQPEVFHMMIRLTGDLLLHVEDKDAALPQIAERLRALRICALIYHCHYPGR